MLYETDEPLIGNFAAKIQDARLGHTISRDDVRRDEYFARAVAFARELAEKRLGLEAARKLKEHAEAGKTQDVELLVDACVQANLTLAEWHVPLVEPIDGAKTIDVASLRKGWGSKTSTLLTRDLARQRQAVILCHDPAALADDLERALGFVLREVEGELTSITPVARTERDEALLATLAEILDEVYRDPGAVVVADLVGLHADRLAIAGHSTDAHIVDRDAAAKNPFALLGRRPLVLSTAHPIVQAARAHDDPRLAAAHLARAVLLHHRLLDVERSHRILELALANSGAV
jgi:molecular chaperone HtpG